MLHGEASPLQDGELGTFASVPLLLSDSFPAFLFCSSPSVFFRIPCVSAHDKVSGCGVRVHGWASGRSRVCGIGTKLPGTIILRWQEKLFSSFYLRQFCGAVQMQAVKEAAEAAEAQDDDGPAEAEGNEEADDHGGGKEARMDDGDAGGEIDMANHEGGDCGPAPGAGLEDCVPAPEAQDVAVGAPDKLECSEVTKEDNAVRGGDEAADAVDQVGGGGGAPAADGTDDGGGEESKMSEAEGAGGDEGMEGAPTEAVGGLGKVMREGIPGWFCAYLVVCVIFYCSLFDHPSLVYTTAFRGLK